MRKPPNKSDSVQQEPEDNLDAAMEMVADTMLPTRKVSVSGDESPSQAQVIVRTTEEERERWKSASAASGMSMSEWIRDLASKAAKAKLECQHPIDKRKVYPWSETCLQCGKRIRG